MLACDDFQRADHATFVGGRSTVRRASFGPGLATCTFPVTNGRKDRRAVAVQGSFMGLARSLGFRPLTASNATSAPIVRVPKRARYGPPDGAQKGIEHFVQHPFPEQRSKRVKDFDVLYIEWYMQSLSISPRP